MQLLLIIAVLAAVVGGQPADGLPVAHAAWRVAGATAGAISVGFVAWIIARHFVQLWQRRQITTREWLRRLDRAQRAHAGLWLAVVLLTIYALNWPQLVRANLQLAAWPLVDDLCVLLPVVLPLLLSWAAFYRIELAMGDEAAAEAQPRESLARHLLWQSRQQLAMLLLPTLLLLGIEDGLRIAAPQMLADNQSWLWAIPALVLLIVGFPLLLRRVWQTEELPAGPLRDRLQTVLFQQGQRVRSLFIWHTGGRMVNAAVAGCLPRWRYIFLTDSLLERFSDEQVAAVVAHELGHVRGRHLLLRVLAMIVPALFLLAISRLLPGEVATVSAPSTVLQQAALAWPFDGKSASTALLFPLGMILYAATVLGRYSRLLELEADYLACCPVGAPPASIQLQGRMSAEQTEQLLSTLAQLATTGDMPADRATWLHPSLVTRASFLLTLLHSPSVQSRFARHLKRMRYLLFIACGLGLLVNLMVG